MTGSSRSVVFRTALALVCTGALAVPLATSAVAEPETDPPPVPTAIVGALARDLGLTPQEAEERVESESRASMLLATVQGLLGGSFGGSWFDAETRQLKVATTDAGAVERIESLGAEATVVARSAQQLADRKAALDAKSADLPAGVTGWYVDPVRNSVVISTTDLIDGLHFGGLAPGVIIEQVTQRARPLAQVDGGSALNSHNGMRCSVGFQASARLQQYVITAGHCTAFGGEWVGLNGEPIGRSTESTYPDNDFGLVRMESMLPSGSAVVLGDRGARIPVTGSAPAPIGASVCRSGANTGWRCGVIESVDQSVSYERDVVNGLVRTTACGELGDSGGPFISGTDAQGILSGGVGTCADNGVTFFQPIGEILATYGVELRTN